MDKLPEDWLFVTLNRIEDAQARHAGEMRLGFESVRAAQAKHELEDALVAADVRTLKQQASERSTFGTHLQTLLISTGLVAGWEGVKHLAGWK